MKFDGALGYVHLMTQAEHDDCGYDACYEIELGISEHGLKKGLPNICWAMIWGQPFIEMIGADALLTAPGQSHVDLRPVGPSIASPSPQASPVVGISQNLDLLATESDLGGFISSANLQPL